MSESQKLIYKQYETGKSLTGPPPLSTIFISDPASDTFGSDTPYSPNLLDYILLTGSKWAINMEREYRQTNLYGDLPDRRICLLRWQGDSLPLCQLGSLKIGMEMPKLAQLRSAQNVVGIP